MEPDITDYDVNTFVADFICDQAKYYVADEFMEAIEERFGEIDSREFQRFAAAHRRADVQVSIE